MTSSLQYFWQGPVTLANENDPCLLFSALTPASPHLDSAMTYAQLTVHRDLSHFPGVRDILSEETTRTTRPLPISAPVPVWCASQDALRSILEMGEREILSEKVQAHVFDGNKAAFAAPDEQLRIQRSSNPSYAQNRPTTEPRMVIRPVTPSTLMALTEPCLMRWCFSSAGEHPDPNGDGIGEAWPDPLQALHCLRQEAVAPLDYIHEMGKMKNKWGY